MDELKPTSWRITTTTKEAWAMMLKGMRSAKTSIYFEQFLFDPDSVGQEFIEALIQKAQAGVTVKCIFDSMWCVGLSQSEYLDKMIEAGVKIKFFNWMLPFSRQNKRIWYFRNHRRLLVIDRETMYTGGVCISKHMEDWRETQIRLEGPVVEQALHVFDRTWKRVYRKHSLNLGRQNKTGIDGFSYITHAPLPRERHLYYRLVEALKSAQKYIYITNAYFVPDNRIVRALILAKRRGVDVRIIVPRRPNHFIVNIASRTYYHRLLKHGVKIYRYENMVHAKTVAIDDDWGMIGTLNLDNISLRYNFESSILATKPQCVMELREIFEKDLKNAPELTLREWQKRSFVSKFLEAIVWPIRKLL